MEYEAPPIGAVLGTQRYPLPDLMGDGGQPSCIAADGNLVALGTLDGAVAIFAPEPVANVTLLPLADDAGALGAVTALAIDSDARVVAAGFESGHVARWVFGTSHGSLRGRRTHVVAAPWHCDPPPMETARKNCGAVSFVGLLGPKASAWVQGDVRGRFAIRRTAGVFAPRLRERHVCVFDYIATPPALQTVLSASATAAELPAAALRALGRTHIDGILAVATRPGLHLYAMSGHTQQLLGYVTWAALLAQVAPVPVLLSALVSGQERPCVTAGVCKDPIEAARQCNVAFFPGRVPMLVVSFDRRVLAVEIQAVKAEGALDPVTCLVVGALELDATVIALRAWRDDELLCVTAAGETVALGLSVANQAAEWPFPQRDLAGLVVRDVWRTALGAVACRDSFSEFHGLEWAPLDYSGNFGVSVRPNRAVWVLGANGSELVSARPVTWAERLQRTEGTTGELSGALQALALVQALWNAGDSPSVVTTDDAMPSDAETAEALLGVAADALAAHLGCEGTAEGAEDLTEAVFDVAATLDAPDFAFETVFDAYADAGQLQVYWDELLRHVLDEGQFAGAALPARAVEALLGADGGDGLGNADALGELVVRLNVTAADSMLVVRRLAQLRLWRAFAATSAAFGQQLESEVTLQQHASRGDALALEALFEVSSASLLGQKFNVGRVEALGEDEFDGELCTGAWQRLLAAPAALALLDHSEFYKMLERLFRSNVLDREVTVQALAGAPRRETRDEEPYKERVLAMDGVQIVSRQLVVERLLGAVVGAGPMGPDDCVPAAGCTAEHVVALYCFVLQAVALGAQGVGRHRVRLGDFQLRHMLLLVTRDTAQAGIRLEESERIRRENAVAALLDVFSPIFTADDRSAIPALFEQAGFFGVSLEWYRTHGLPQRLFPCLLQSAWPAERILAQLEAWHGDADLAAQLDWDHDIWTQLVEAPVFQEAPGTLARVVSRVYGGGDRHAAVVAELERAGRLREACAYLDTVAASSGLGELALRHVELLCEFRPTAVRSSLLDLRHLTKDDWERLGAACRAHSVTVGLVWCLEQLGRPREAADALVGDLQRLVSVQVPRLAATSDAALHQHAVAIAGARLEALWDVLDGMDGAETLFEVLDTARWLWRAVHDALKLLPAWESWWQPALGELVEWAAARLAGRASSARVLRHIANADSGAAAELLPIVKSLVHHQKIEACLSQIELDALRRGGAAASADLARALLGGTRARNARCALSGADLCGSVLVNPSCGHVSLVAADRSARALLASTRPEFSRSVGSEAEADEFHGPCVACALAGESSERDIQQAALAAVRGSFGAR